MPAVSLGNQNSRLVYCLTFVACRYSGGPRMANRTLLQTAVLDDLVKGSRRRTAMLAVLRVFHWMIGSDGFLLSLAGLIVGGSFALSMTTDAWHWYQRSGALLVSIGAVFSTRHVLRSTIDTLLHEQSSSGVSPGRNSVDNFEGSACLIGFCMVGVGTLIWAYGDLTGCLLGSSCL